MRQRMGIGMDGCMDRKEEWESVRLDGRKKLIQCGWMGKRIGIGIEGWGERKGRWMDGTLDGSIGERMVICTNVLGK